MPLESLSIENFRSLDNKSSAWAIANEARYFQVVYSAYMAEFREALSEGRSQEEANLRASELCQKDDFVAILEMSEASPERVK